MPRKRHPELDGYHQSQPLYTFELKSQRKTIRNRLIWMLVGLAIGTGGAALAYFLLPEIQQRVNLPQVELTEDDPFRVGSSQAMNAAELTQTAEFQEDWGQVALLWQQAISSMKAVPASHPSYAIAQQKLEEYERNLQYAQSNVSSRSPSNPAAQTYWTVGSDRELVIAVQGKPAQVSRYDASCKEVFYYGDSTVELSNGYVVDYSNLDGNLKVLGNEKVAMSVQPQAETWTIGSSQEEVFQVQGTPTRTSSYLDTVTLHYDESSVELKDNRVTGYSNEDRNLKVSMMPVATEGQPSPSASWTLGSSRIEVLSAEQQTPVAVNRLDSNCEEVFTFDDNSVIFQRGLVSEYSQFRPQMPL